MGSVFSRLSEIPCLLTRVITNTKGSICPAAIRGEVGPSATGRPASWAAVVTPAYSLVV